MRNFIIGLVIGLALGAAVTVIADPSWIGAETIWNRIFDSTTNTLRVVGQ